MAGPSSPLDCEPHEGRTRPVTSLSPAPPSTGPGKEDSEIMCQVNDTFVFSFHSCSPVDLIQWSSLCVAHHTLSPSSLDPLPASSQISSQMCLLQQAFPELQARPGASSVLPPALQTCPVVATIWGDTDGCSSSCELHEAAPDEYG